MTAIHDATSFSQAGSSPLARGLQDRRGEGPDPVRIIPARAGFTTPWSTASRRTRDHPRSRGVYRTQPQAAPTPSGSSPLARGLLRRRTDAMDAAGIIPARAGFTPIHPESRCTTSDHPRSRGVYCGSNPSTSVTEGSSPLARGLRLRAGAATYSPVDHPRSRGVYGPGGSRCGSWCGSSPLARGLRTARRRRPRRRRIIPARAGFTPGRAGHGPGPTDHPRSRGVYLGGRRLGVAGLGSSPLARGLRLASLTPAARTRIIPARAGFTPNLRSHDQLLSDHPRSRGVYGSGFPWSSSGRGSSPLARGLRTGRCPTRRWCRDHPRSRGVYSFEATGEPGKEGSSPLARGLPSPGWVVPAHGGIIPARAGFTTSRRPRTRRTPDHPRSRGVYVVVSAGDSPLAGSSPLARGLRADTDHRRGDHRIIPARAGFTSRGVIAAVESSDHPRSRGVYHVSGADKITAMGSSPLARGLPVVRGADPAGRGIIPARAGFTGSPPSSRGPGPDHPRSRGVYKTVIQTGAALGGSSPLARGLLWCRRRGVLGGRIIPARAGFTLAAPASRTITPDHPRSRGVYRVDGVGLEWPLGSSPLARGLLHPARDAGGDRRIIPARAGFT